MRRSWRLEDDRFVFVNLAHELRLALIESRATALLLAGVRARGMRRLVHAEIQTMVDLYGWLLETPSWSVAASLRGPEERLIIACTRRARGQFLTRCGLAAAAERLPPGL